MTSKDELREALDKWKPIFVNEVIPSEFVDAILNLLEGEKQKLIVKHAAEMSILDQEIMSLKAKLEAALKEEK